jgi:hypothetical protein
MNRPDDGLPRAMLRLIPEMTGAAWDAEPMASCSRCAMRTAPHPKFEAAYLFTSPANCCTYHPDLANFLAGRALSRGDEGSVRVLRRMSQPAGVRPEGIFPHSGYMDYFARMRSHDPKDWFGRTRMVCPFWVGGERPCGIYADRNAVCRTWFCKHDSGARGFRAWKRLQTILETAELTLARKCIADGKPPAKGAPRGEWVDWFLWTARHVEALSDDDLASIVHAEMVEERLALKDEVQRRDAPMPDIVVPSVLSFERKDDEVELVSYSGYDRRVYPSIVFELFSRLDGSTPWQDALAATNAEIGRELGVALVADLWGFGLLTVPEDRVWKPGWEMAPGTFGAGASGLAADEGPTIRWDG